MTNLNEIIIIGGGISLQKGINLGLRERLEGKCVIVCNYAYKHFPHTFLTFLDRNFYVPNHAKDPKMNNPDIYEELRSEPLIIGVNYNGIEEFKLDNTILLPQKYLSVLTGVFALKLATMIMEGGNIYLLGFDWNRRFGLPERDPNYNPNSDMQIHYYNDVKHRGSGYLGYYENHNPDKEFSEFINKKDVKIFNVSLESNINIFPKISYNEMFNLLNPIKINQENLRQNIKNLII